MRDIQIKVPQHLAPSARAMGLEWWYEAAGPETWCSCCERKNIPVSHVGSTRDGHNVGICRECIGMLRSVLEAGALGSSKDKPLTADHVEATNAPPTSNRVEEVKPARRKRSEMRRSK